MNKLNDSKAGHETINDPGKTKENKTNVFEDSCKDKIKFF